MNNVYFIILMALVFFGCQPGQTNTKNHAAYSDSSLNNYSSPGNAVITKKSQSDTTDHVDTIFKKVNIKGNYYSIVVLRDQYRFPDTTDLLKFYPLTIRMIAENDSHLVFTKHFIENEFYFFKNNNKSLGAPGKLYLGLTSIGGGSGWSNNLLSIDIRGNELHVDTLVYYGELDLIAFSKSEAEIILLSGIWGLEDSHFSDHRYKIYRYFRSGSGYTKVLTGITHFKYSASPETNCESLIKAIKSKEPKLMTAIEPGSYGYFTVSKS